MNDLSSTNVSVNENDITDWLEDKSQLRHRKAVRTGGCASQAVNAPPGQPCRPPEILALQRTVKH